MDEGWRLFDHTADLGLEVWAPTPERLFAVAAVAMLAQVAQCDAAGGEEVSADIAVAGEDAADLLVEWLSRALLAAELERAVWTHAEMERLDSREAVGRLRGPRRDRARMTYLREVKAVSHHALELTLAPGTCRCRVVLDL
jgi:SHS2 domain-containing protein